jgi:hypothetical protein
MSVNLNNDGTLAITAMSLVEFLPEIETAIHNGFMLNLNKNEGVPQIFGALHVLTMYPTGDIVVTSTKTEKIEPLHPQIIEGNLKPRPEVVQEAAPSNKVDGRRKK